MYICRYNQITYACTVHTVSRGSEDFILKSYGAFYILSTASQLCSTANQLSTIAKYLIVATKHSRVKILWILYEPQMFSHKFQSVLAFVDVVLMQTQKSFHKYLYSHGDLTAKVLSLDSFVLNKILCVQLAIYLSTKLLDTMNP